MEAQATDRVNLIGICGFAQSGKDTAAAALTEIGWTRIAFADPLREGALGCDPIVGYEVVKTERRFSAPWGRTKAVPLRLSDLVRAQGWDKAKQNPEVRRFLQRYGTEGGRHVHGPDCWTKIAEDRLACVLASGGRAVITDVRFDNEAEMIRDRGGLVVRISRPNNKQVNRHVSENLNFKVDHCIYNTTTKGRLREQLLELAGVKTCSIGR